jgi:hypothetical protein
VPLRCTSGRCIAPVLCSSVCTSTSVTLTFVSRLCNSACVNIANVGSGAAQLAVQNREHACALATAVDDALRDAGAPCSIPPFPSCSLTSQAADDQYASDLRAWSPQRALQPELEVWTAAEAELARQVALHCSERGAVLARAFARRDEVLHVRYRCSTTALRPLHLGHLARLQCSRWVEISPYMLEATCS